MMTLHFYGPYGMTSVGGWPLLSTSAVAQKCGIYVWTAQLPDRYRIGYVGKADGQGGMLSRLIAEVDRYLRQLRGDQCYDVCLFRQGIRKQIPPDSVSLQGGIDWSPVFIAPINCDKHLLLLIESAIIRRLRENHETKSFLVNKHCRGEALSEQLQVTSNEDVTLEGLQQPLL
jgi:hypothetical protein